jgi:outer membrane protein TolC
VEPTGAEALVARALAQRRDLNALERDLEAVRLGRRAADRVRVPEPELTAGLKNSDRGGTGGIFSVAVAIPLFDSGASARARLSVLEREINAELVSRRTEIRTSVLALSAIVNERRAAVERFRRAAVAQAEELQRVAEVSYENAIRGILELLDVYRAGAAARIRLAELELALRRAEIELQELMGDG